MNELLMKVDPTMWYILGGILVLLVVVSLIKSAIKLAVCIGLLAIAFLFFGPASGKIQEQYNVRYEQGVIAVTVEGVETKISTVDLKQVKLEKSETGDSYVVFVYEGSEESIKIPNLMETFLQSKLQEMNEKILE